MVKNILFSILILFCLSNCKKHNANIDNPPMPSLVCKITGYTQNGIKQYDVKYDNTHKVDTVINYVTNPALTCMLQYNVNGRLVKTNINSSGILGAYISYGYDVNGFRTSDTLYKFNFSTFTYPADSVITYSYTVQDITRRDNIKVGGAHLYTLFTYNLGILNTEKAYNGTTLLYTKTYSYDLNSTMDNSAVFFIDPVTSSQTHRILSVTTTGGTTTFNQANSYNAVYTQNGNTLTETDTYQNTLVNTITYASTCN
jgi:hypothetical protein